MNKRLGLVLYYVIYAFIYAGWIFHRCDQPVVFRYSRNYFVFLVGMSVFFFLPPLARRYKAAVGAKNFWFSIIPCAVLGVLVYMGGSLYYYYTQVHGFEPFVQVHYYRYDPAAEAKSDGEVRVLCLGGSTTRNFRLPPDKRYPSVLEAMLQKQYPARKVTVFNAGMDWYTTKHSLINYVTYYRDWQPDVVVVMHAINDLCRSLAPPAFSIGTYNDRWSHYYGPAINAAKPPTFERHVFGEFANTWYSMFRFREVDYPVDTYVAVRPFERNLRKIVAYVRSDRTRVVLVTQPSLYKPDMSADERAVLVFGKKFCACPQNLLQKRYPSPQSLGAAQRAFNAVARRVASAEGVVLVDAEQRVPKDLDHFSDDVHYTEQGARLLAQLVADTLVDARLVTPRRPGPSMPASQPSRPVARRD